jgi:hypothetical protein
VHEGKTFVILRVLCGYSFGFGLAQYSIPIHSLLYSYECLCFLSITRSPFGDES